jgi:hypothetical protein
LKNEADDTASREKQLLQEVESKDPLEEVIDEAESEDEPVKPKKRQAKATKS